MEQQIFLRIDDVRGESQDENHREEIEVLNWSFTLNLPISTSANTRRRTQPAPPVISITHYIDRASTALMLLHLRQEVIREAVLSVRSSGRNPVDYLNISMERCTIQSLTPMGEAGLNRMTETMTITFAKMKEEYTVIDHRGSPAETTTAEWDFTR